MVSIEKVQKFVVAHVNADEEKVKKKKVEKKKEKFVILHNLEKKCNFLSDTVQDKKIDEMPDDNFTILLFKLTPAKVTKILLGKTEILIQIFCQWKMKFKLQIIIPKLKLK